MQPQNYKHVFELHDGESTVTSYMPAYLLPQNHESRKSATDDDAKNATNRKML
jgi:hypothetical protein